VVAFPPLSWCNCQNKRLNIKENYPIQTPYLSLEERGEGKVKKKKKV